MLHEPSSMSSTKTSRVFLNEFGLTSHQILIQSIDQL